MLINSLLPLSITRDHVLEGKFRSSFCSLIQPPFISKYKENPASTLQRISPTTAAPKMCYLQMPPNFSKLNLTNFVCLDFHKACSLISIRQK